MPATRLNDQIAERFWRYVIKREGDDCWGWKSHRSTHGYAHFLLRHNLKVHARRVAWELTCGRIPPAMVIIKKPPCRSLECVRPDHHECVSKADAKKRKAWNRHLEELEEAGGVYETLEPTESTQLDDTTPERSVPRETARLTGTPQPPFWAVGEAEQRLQAAICDHITVQLQPLRVLVRAVLQVGSRIEQIDKRLLELAARLETRASAEDLAQGLRVAAEATGATRQEMLDAVEEVWKLVQPPPPEPDPYFSGQKTLATELGEVFHTELGVRLPPAGCAEIEGLYLELLRAASGDPKSATLQFGSLLTTLKQQVAAGEAVPCLRDFVRVFRAASHSG